MVDKIVDGVIAVWAVGVTVAEHVDGVDVEVFSVSGDVAHIGFGVAAGAV